MNLSEKYWHNMQLAFAMSVHANDQDTLKMLHGKFRRYRHLWWQAVQREQKASHNAALGGEVK